ncbi:MAG: AraC family transcriptional regulator [Bacteroidota bacterium]
MIKTHQHFELLGKKIFERAVIEPPLRMTAEMPNEACFFYLVKGKSNVIQPTQRVILEAEEGLVLKCGNYLNDYFNAAGADTCEAIAIHFYPEILKLLYDKEFPDFLLEVNKVKPVTYKKVKSSLLMTAYIESLQFYFDNPSLVSDELIKIKLKELILLLAKTNNADNIKALISSLFSSGEQDFKAVIEANIFNNLSLDELAALTNLSLSSFKREFSKQYNCPPAKYIKQRKLGQAAKLLKATSLRITDIAFDCGFSDLAHFSKSFQKAYGLAPSDYRLD